MRTVIWLAGTAISLGLACGIPGVQARGPHIPDQIRTEQNYAVRSTDLSSLPSLMQSSVSASVGQDIPTYFVRGRRFGLLALNAQHRLAVKFTSTGIKLHRGSACWKLGLRSYGYGDELRRVAPVLPYAKLNRVEYRRGVLTEWYVNGPAGLEQGFTLTEPPGRAHGRPLTITLAMAGDLTAALEPGGTGLGLIDRTGKPELRYTGLTAHDAAGRTLRTWLEVHGQQLSVQVAGSGAVYPLTIDPFVQQAELTASDGATQDELGWSVAISGSTVVVGAPGFNSNSSQGSAYVFVKPANGWTTMTQTAKLTASDGALADWFGSSVAISGSTVVVGAFGATIGSNRSQGAAYVFVKPASGWTNMTESAKLTDGNGVAGEEFGYSVATNSNAVLVGAPGATVGSNTFEGAGYVFVKPTSGWATTSAPEAQLTASDGAAGDSFGSSVAISGTTAVAGQPNINSYQGAAYVFVQPPSGWTTKAETAKLTASDGRTGDEFGFSVSMSGNTIVAGARNAKVGANVGQGAAYVYVMPSGGWETTSAFTAKLSAGNRAHFNFGTSVTISGNLIVAGVPTASITQYQAGTAYVFIKPVSGWTTTTKFNAKLLASDGKSGNQFGKSVAVSFGTIVAGAPYHRVGSTFEQGAAYIF